MASDSYKDAYNRLINALIIRFFNSAINSVGVSFEWSNLLVKEVIRYIFPTQGIMYATGYLALPHNGMDFVSIANTVRFVWAAFCGYSPPSKALLHFIWTGIPCILYSIGIILCFKIERILMAVLLPSRPFTGFLLRVLVELTLERFTSVDSKLFPIAVYLLQLFVWFLAIIYKTLGDLISLQVSGFLAVYLWYKNSIWVLLAFISIRAMDKYVFQSKELLDEFVRFDRRSHRLENTETNDAAPIRNDYTYRPLQQGSIRLLKLFPTDQPDTWNFSLISQALSDRPDFIAISYTWLPSNRSALPRELTIEGGTLSVLQSTYEILMEQVVSWKEPADTLFWIDSVCINQQDRAEKEQQVPLMGMIYSFARAVIVYLPPSDQDSADIAVYFLKALEKNARERKARRFGPFGFNIQSLRSVLKLVAPGWNELNGLIGHRYWDRVWIVQEIANATQLRIFYGENEISLRILLELQSMMNEPKLHAYLDFDGVGNVRGHFPGYGLRRIENIAAKREIVQSRGSVQARSEIQIQDILLMSRDMDATYPSDRVFATQSLLSSQEAVPSSLRPDYAASAEVVYRRVAEYFLANDPLWLLNMAGLGQIHNRTSDITIDLPSWVPNWTMSSPFILPSATTCASRDRKEIVVNHTLDSRVLEIVSKRVDVVQDVSRLPTSYQEDIDLDPWKITETYLDDSLEFYRLADALPSSYSTGVSSVAALLCTLKAGTAQPSREDIRSFVHLAASSRTQLPILKAAFRGQGGISRTKGVLEAGFPDVGEKLFTSNYSTARKLAVTISGCLALVPRSTKPGDVIHVLEDLKSFFVLRQDQDSQASIDQYHLVGACYIHARDGDQDSCSNGGFVTVTLI